MTRLVLLGVLGLLGAGGQPPAGVAEARGDLDGDGRPERVQVGADGSVRIDGADGTPRARVALGARVERATVAIVDVGGHAVAHVAAPLGPGAALEAVLAGAGEVIYLGRTGPVGDGERSERLRVDGRGVVRWQTSPTMVRCDGDDVLFPEHWDFQLRRFVAVEGAVPEGAPLTATPSAPSGLPAAPLGAFRFVAASTDAAAAAERRADRLAAPRELDDGSPRSAWIAGGRGAWATARAASTLRLGVARILGGPGTPRALVLVLGRGRAYRVALLDTDGPEYVRFPDAPPTACVSVVVAEPAAEAPTRLREIAFYTDADAAGGLDQLVEEVAAERPGAAAAAALLSHEGPAAARALARALEAPRPGRRRLLEVLARLAPEAAPVAAPALGRALETASAAERPTVTEALVRLGVAGGAEAARVLADPAQAPEARADAARVLGRVARDEPRFGRALLDGKSQDREVRAATREALTQAGTANPSVLEALIAALEAAGSDGARAGDLGRALGRAARGGPSAARAAQALATAYRAASGFEPRLRLLRAMADLGDAALAPLVDEVARHDPDEVLRWAATQAAAALGAAGRPSLVAAAADGDPRVRKQALGALADGKLLLPALAGDRWPMVRRAAAEALGNACPSAAELTRAATGDRSEEVRRAALSSLPRCPGDATPTLTRVLANSGETPSVRELAAALLAKHGGAAAARALAATLDQVLADPSADERAAGLALTCTRALGRLSDRSRPVLEALGAAANEPLSPPLRAGALEAIGQLCPDGAQEALARGAQDPDGGVRRAAARALAACRH
jgi:hypothetical protein